MEIQPDLPIVAVDDFLDHERERLVTLRYAEIVAALSQAAANDASAAARGVLADAATSLRRIAADLPVVMLAERLAEPERLTRLSYVSFATQRDPAALARDAAEISRLAQKRNAAAGVTGALAAGSGWFAQVLEGPRRALLATFDRILMDPRHTDIRVIEFQPVPSRAFPDWTMHWAGTLDVGFTRRIVVAHLRQEQRGGPAASRYADDLLGRLASSSGASSSGAGVAG